MSANPELMMCHTCLGWYDKRLLIKNPATRLPLDSPSCLNCIKKQIRHTRTELSELMALQSRIERQAAAKGISMEEVPDDEVTVTRRAWHGMGGSIGRKIICSEKG